MRLATISLTTAAFLLIGVTVMSSVRAAEPQKAAAIAEVAYRGPRVTLKVKNLAVVMESGVSHDPLLCGTQQAAPATSCNALVVRANENGNPAFTMWGPAFSQSSAGLPDEADRLHAKVTIRRLDAATTSSQVIFTFYTGGAHCCTSFQIATVNENGTWRVINAGQVDGDIGYEFDDINHDGVSELVDVDETFNYHFASYAGSYAPTRILQLQGNQLVDVTQNPAYRGFLRQHLHDMEEFRKKQGTFEINGYLAGWVAQKSLVGQLDDAWRTMLGSYDHSSTNGLTYCRIDKRAWEKAGSYEACPNGQEAIVPYPEALALFLVKGGYLTPEQSERLGYNVPKIVSDRMTLITSATAEFERRKIEGWYWITRTGNCVQARTSPADLITADRASGLIDSVLVLKSDDTGKPAVVRVGEPQSGDLETVNMFFRGLAECQSYRETQQRQLENLK